MSAGLYLLIPVVLFFFYSCSFHSGVPFDSASIRSDFQKVFRNTTVLKVEPSELPGVFRIHYGGNFSGSLYYFPDKKAIFIGKLFFYNSSSLLMKNQQKLPEKYER